MNRILVVDDDTNIRYSFGLWLKSEHYDIDEATNGMEAIVKVRTGHYDVVIMDIRMPEMSGLEAFKIIHGEFPNLPVIITTAYGTTDTAIETMRLGAYDYILKPLEVKELSRIIELAINDSRLARSIVRLPSQPPDGSGMPRIVGSSTAMQAIYKIIGKASSDDSTVLITGPSGSGKELVAQALYHYGLRKEKAFQAINCAAMPDQLLESELFGHEKGAFTGAHKTKIGRFERCDGGTLFLDEIGDMSLAMQAKILRVIQERTFERVGGVSTLKADVRVIAATNRNLEEAVKNGQFREDLYYRLRVVHIEVPPLSERTSDIGELIDYFIRRHNRTRQVPIEGITDEARQFLVNYNWPGNVRELENAVRRAMVLCTVNILKVEDFSFLVDGAAEAGGATDGNLNALGEALFDEYADEKEPNLLEKMERLLIETTLQKTGGNQVKAAGILGINRNTLRNKMVKHGLLKE